MPPPPPISKQGLWDPRSSEEQAGRRRLDPEGLVAGTPSAWTQLSQRRGCPLLLTAGVAALGQGKGRASLGKWGRLKLLPGTETFLIEFSRRSVHGSCSSVTRTAGSPGQQPGGAGLGLQPVTPCSTSLGILVSESSPGLFCRVSACWDLRGPGGQPGKRPRGWASQQPPPQAGAGSDS